MSRRKKVVGKNRRTTPKDGETIQAINQHGQHVVARWCSRHSRFEEVKDQSWKGVEVEGL